jgi:hypothetical protein
LVSKGVSAARIVAKGYAPGNQSEGDTGEGKDRTELKILSK